MALTPRQKLLLKTLVPGVAVVVGLGLLFAFSGGGDTYRPGDDVEGITASLKRDVPAGFTPVPFTEMARAAGLEMRHFHGGRSSQLPEDMGSGAAFGDYDGDGDPDLYVVNNAGPLTARDAWPASPARNRLFRNDGGGRFTDVTDAAGVGLRHLGMGACFADVDGDRDLDLLVTAYGGMTLFVNGGDGTFTDGTAAAGLTQEGFWTGAAFGDHDRDGDLDLYVCGYVMYDFKEADRNQTVKQYDLVIPKSLNPSAYRPHPNLLLENDGAGGFTDITARAGVANAEGRSLSVTWCDFDEDGWQDIYVANDISDNVLFRNGRDGTFQDVSHTSSVADYRGAMGMAVADYDLDRDLDLFITHWIAQENALYVNLRADDRELGMARVGAYCRFQDDADRMGVGQVALDYVGWGTFFLDFDNDGRPDLFVANGSTFQQADDARKLVPMKPLLFWNIDARRGFVDVSAFCGDYFAREWVGRGAACADVDQDGDVDLVVVHHDGELAFLRNDLANGNRWIGIRLAGKDKNSHGLGALVSVSAGGAVQTQAVGATVSYLSQPDVTLHFGLGAQDRAGSVEIRWPRGAVQTLAGLAAGRVHVIEEP